MLGTTRGRIFLTLAASLVIVIGSLIYGTTDEFKERMLLGEKVIISEAFSKYKQDQMLINIHLQKGKIPPKEGKRLVSVVSQTLPERVSIEYVDGIIKMKDWAKDPWGFKYEMKMIVSDEGKLEGFLIQSDKVEIKI